MNCNENRKDIDLRNFAAIVPLAILLMTAGCGGGGGNDTPSFAANVQPVTVDPGPTGNVNVLFTTVTICAPGSNSNCQSIDHVLVDTGSTGLRILSSLLSPSLSLQQETTLAGNAIVECGQFADGFTWGPVKLADVKISGERANSVPIQVIADPAFSTVPGSCSGIGPAEDTVQTLGANGVLGIGTFQQDCGTTCVNNTMASSIYYTCPSGTCQPAQASLPQQLQNPVGLFSRDNNGVIISLPPIPAMGAAGASGIVIFGIGTQGNNALGNAQVIPLDPNNGNFTTILGAVTYSKSFIDSGSNALFFADTNIATCTSSTASGFDCPTSLQNLSATNQGISGPASIVSFQVANADTLFNSNLNFFAFGNLAGPNSDPASFDWGLPFFFGRNVFTAIEGQSTPAGIGPYVAY